MKNVVATPDLHRFISAARKSSFGTHVATVASGTAIAQILPVALTPVLTRLYDPGDMGMLGLFTSFISFFTGALTLGYSQAVVAGRTKQESADLIFICTLLVGPFSVLGGILLYVFVRMGWLGYGELPGWSALAIMLSLVLTGFFFTLRAWLVRAEEFRHIAVATVSQSIGRMTTQIVAGLMGLHWVGLIIGEVVGRGAGLSRVWTAAGQEIKVSLGQIDVQRLYGVASRYRKFPLYTMPSSLLNSASLVLPIPLMTAYFGVAAAGQFAIASRVMQMPLSFIGTSIGDVFHSRIARLSREDPGRAMRFFLIVTASLAALGVAPAVIVLLWGDHLFETVLGEQWVTAGMIAASIVPWVFMQLVVSPVSRVVQVYQGQEFKLVYDTVALISIVGILTIGSRAGWTLVATSQLLGWSQAGVYGIYLLLLVQIMKRNTFINVSSG